MWTEQPPLPRGRPCTAGPAILVAPGALLVGRGLWAGRSSQLSSWRWDLASSSAGGRGGMMSVAISLSIGGVSR